MAAEGSLKVLDWIMEGGFLAIVLFSIATYIRVGKVKDDTDTKIGEVKKEKDSDVTTLFRRLDEVKDKVDVTYTKKDVCEVVHKAVAETLSDVKIKVACIPDIKAGVDSLLRKNGLKSD